jgi:hypothetical protein
MTAHRFALFADYHQFYLQDEHANGDLSAAWTPEAVDRLLAIAPGVIGVGTATDMDVPVELEVLDAEPRDDRSGWERVNDCSIDIPSGRLVIAGCTDYFPEAARIDLPAGSYSARVYYAGLAAAASNPPDGTERYRVALWKRH